MLLKKSLLFAMTIVVFASCGDVTQQVEDKLNLLNSKVEQLDTIINNEMDKVKTLDTLINFERNKVKQLDSLINNSSSRIDSLTTNKIDKLKNILK